jgi:hypothetical protein
MANRGRKRTRAPGSLEGSRVHARPALTVPLVSLAAVLLLQLAITWNKLASPFLDTRLHFFYDNALYSFTARNGIRNGDLRSQFGVTNNRYSSWGQSVGSPSYYTDHPFLTKALFQQYARLVGTEEWASRTFYLGIAFATAAGLYVIVLNATGGSLAAVAAAGTFVSLPLIAIYQICVKSEADGLLMSTWFFVALQSHLRRGSRRSACAIAVLAFAAVLTHWTAALFVIVVLACLLVIGLFQRNESVRRSSFIILGGSIAGALTLFGLMSYLQHGWEAARTTLITAFARRSAPVPRAEWLARQREYFHLNFGRPMAWVLLILIGRIVGQWWRRRSRDEGSESRSVRRHPPTLALFFWATTIVGVLWVVGFPQGSYIHVYWQYWLAAPIAVLVAAAIAPLRSTPGRVLASLGLVSLMTYSVMTALAEYRTVVADELGTPGDVAFIRSLREDRFERFDFVPLSEVTLNQWFQGPLFEYYSDRPVRIATSPADIGAHDKLLVLKYKQRDQLLAALSRWSGKVLGNEKCGEHICAYDIVQN